MTPTQSVQYELENHAAAMRALARDLVGGSDADDLVQETALRALRTPPERPGSLAGFFATILRNLASKHRRSERHRQAREQLAARAEAQPGADHFAERRETLRCVTVGVFALPEPYLTTVLLRYFEDLTPTAIAARTGAPLATVKSRLQRGLALLRADLDRTDGRQRWQRALLLATGLHATRPLLLTTGALLMAPTTKLALAAATVLVGAALLFTLQNNAEPSPAATTTASSPPVVDAVLGADQTAPRASERTEMPGTRAVNVDLAHPFGFELRCSVRDRDGLPVEGAQLFLAPAGCALNTWGETTSAAGSVVLRWHGKQQAMSMVIGVRRDGLAQGLQQIEVQAGAARELALLGETNRDDRAREVMRRKEAQITLADKFAKQSDSSTCPRHSAPPSQECRSCHAGPTQFRGLFDERLKVRAGLHPQATFADLLLPAAAKGETNSVAAQFAERLQVKVLAEYETRVATRLVLGTKLDAKVKPAATNAGSIAGFVFDASGKPVPDTTVVWGTAVDLPSARTRTGKDGAFTFQDVPIGSIELRAGGGDQGLQHVRVSVGGPVRQDLVLAEGAMIRGRALGADGAPLAGWRVEYAAASEPWLDACLVHQDGSFVLANLPGGPGRLLLWPRDAGALPVAIEPSVLPDSGEVVFDLQQRGEPKGALRVEPTVADEAGAVAAEARVWQRDSSRGAAMEHDQHGAFVLEHLAAGFYRVEVGAETSGWVDLGETWVDGKGLCDLGRVALPRPGRVHVARAAAEPAITLEFYLRRPDGDLRAEDVSASQASDLLLPPGAWLCLWRVEGGELHAQPFTVRPGAAVELQVGVEAAGNR